MKRLKCSVFKSGHCGNQIRPLRIKTASTGYSDNAETIAHDESHNAGSDLLCGVTTMSRKTVIALLAVVLIGLSPTAASARGFGFHGFGGGGWHGGGWGYRGFGGWGLGAGVFAGAVIGGAIASSAYGYSPYYGGGYYPGYSYYPAYAGYSPYYDYGPWQAIQEPGEARFYRPYGYGWGP
jgi:hypothetical protein